MRPVAVVVAPEVTPEEAAQLEALADRRTCVVRLRPAHDETDLDADVRRAVGHR